MITAMRNCQDRWPQHQQFEYIHPPQLQDQQLGVGKPYAVRVNYSDPGGNGVPMIAIGGLTNVVERFDFIALDARSKVRIFGLDLVGRGRSGWMAEQTDYSLPTYVEQIRQFMDHLQLDRCALLGSSLGGSAALTFSVLYPERVSCVVLNDSAPFIPVERRRRRAIAVGRHYVFRSPTELFRRSGASVRHVGPTSDAVVLHNIHHKTRWSDEEDGRIYRHDLRSMLAYREEANESLNLWDDWYMINCPILLLHGTKSDATSDATVEQMRTYAKLSVIQVKGAGHTPSLSDGKLSEMIVDWVIHPNQIYLEDKHFEMNLNLERVLFPAIT